MQGLARPRLAVVVLFALVAVYLVSPDQAGALLLLATAISGVTAFVIGPLIRRPVNRRPWRWLAGAGALFLASLLLRFELLEVSGPLGVPDIWAFIGYLCIALFLRGLLQQTQSGLDPTLVLDTGAITTGSLLIGWVTIIAPEIHASDANLGNVVGMTMYPVMDAVVLALTVQLAFRRGARLPALQAAIMGLTALLLGDLTYTVVWFHDPGALSTLLNVFYLIAYACLGYLATHPSMRELSDTVAPLAPRPGRVRLAVVFLTLMTPAAVPIMVPPFGLLDSAVRALLLAALGIFVFQRLLNTIGALRNAERVANWRGTHDSLTGLPNRTAMMDRLGPLMQSRDHARVSALIIDCDHFKLVNDSWGHLAGDDALMAFASRLKSLLGPDDLLARIGGDEFVVVHTEDDPSKNSAIDLATRIVATLKKPQEPAERETSLTASIGISQYTVGSTPLSADDMIRNADIALYEAKQRGRATFTLYDESMHSRIVRRHELAESLKSALSHDELKVAFQPIRRGPGFAELIGWEALVRWQHPKFGNVPPLDFIEIAEDTGLIVDIGAFVLEESCRQVRAWQSEFGSDDLHVAVNVSSVQLLRDDFVSRVTEALREHDLTATSLWLEITESVVLEQTARCARS